MSERDIKNSLKRSRKSELIAWKVGLKDEVRDNNKLISRIDRELKKR